MMKRTLIFLIHIISLNACYGMLKKDLQQKWLYEAVEKDDGDKVKELLEAGAEPNRALIEYEPADEKYKKTPTYHAIKENKPHALKALLKHGGDPDATKTRHHSAFFSSLKPERSAVLNLLLEYGATRPVDDYAKKACFSSAIASQDPLIVRAFIDHKFLTGQEITADILPENPYGNLLTIETILLEERRKWRKKEIKKIEKKRKKRIKKRKCPDDEREEICPFCQEELSSKVIHKGETFNCSHNKKFHMLCIQELLKREEGKMFPQIFCPLCKAKPPAKKTRILSIVRGEPVDDDEERERSFSAEF